MAVDEDDVTVHHTTVKFDGDWAKAAAIDAALTYGLLYVRLKRNKIESQLAGEEPVNASDFTAVTAIFEEVLRQRGYAVFAKDAELEERVNSLMNRIHQLIDLNDKQDENLDKQAEEINELQEKNLQLHEELATAQAEIAQLRAKLLGSYDPEEPADTFRASKCGGRNPYRASNGAPCLGPRTNLGDNQNHQDETGFMWSVDNGVDEEVARSLQAAYARAGQNFVFQKSRCDGLHRYHTEDGIPCVLGPGHEERPHMGKTVDGMDVYWYDHSGVDEVHARSLQLANQPK